MTRPDAAHTAFATYTAVIYIIHDAARPRAAFAATRREHGNAAPRSIQAFGKWLPI